MDIQTNGTSGASLEIISAKLSKDRLEQEGKMALQLLETASGVPTASVEVGKGSIIDTYA